MFSELEPGAASAPPLGVGVRRRGAFPSIVAALLAAACGLAAQTRPVVLRSHDTDSSLRAFMACDLDRDDRITFREASQTLGVATPAAFRLWDRHNLGWVSFPEFDRVFRQKVREGQGLVLHGPAAAAVPTQERALSPSALFRLLDLDQDGSIVPREWQAAPSELAALLARIPQGFFGLDRDRDSRLSPGELALIELLVPALARGLHDPELLRATLPLELQRADRDRDQHLQKDELESFLASLDPALALWVGPLFRHLDRNGDGRVSPREARALIVADQPLDR